MTLPPNIKVHHKISKEQRSIIPRPIGKQLIFTDSQASIIPLGKGFSRISQGETFNELVEKSKVWRDQIENNKKIVKKNV